MKWPDTVAVGELLQTRIRACMQQVLEATDALVCELETVLEWLNGMEAKQTPTSKQRGRHNKRDSIGRFSK